MGIEFIENVSILTPTSGFLDQGFTHSLNLYFGCSFSRALCGVYCYVQHNQYILKGRDWEFYGPKKNIIEPYIKEYKKLKNKNKSLNIFMSSSTDPYLPQEKKYELTKSLLEIMLELPPDKLVIQTRSPLIERDIDIISKLSQKSIVRVSMTIETDYEKLPGFPNHASLPSKRFEAIKKFKDNGIMTQVTVSPLLPIKDIESFAQKLDESCDRVILDHFLIGDGSKDGSRTKKTSLINLLKNNGFFEWSKIDKLYEIKSYLESKMGKDRVLISKNGFNSF